MGDGKTVPSSIVDMLETLETALTLNAAEADARLVKRLEETCVVCASVETLDVVLLAETTELDVIVPEDVLVTVGVDVDKFVDIADVEEMAVLNEEVVVVEVLVVEVVAEVVLVLDGRIVVVFVAFVAHCALATNAYCMTAGSTVTLS